MACSIHFGFYTLSVVPLAAAAILFATAPIFATIFSVALGRETIGPRRTLAIIVGFLGTIIVMRPSSDQIDVNMIYGITKPQTHKPLPSFVFSLHIFQIGNVNRTTQISMVFTR